MLYSILCFETEVYAAQKIYCEVAGVVIGLTDATFLIVVLISDVWWCARWRSLAYQVVLGEGALKHLKWSLSILDFLRNFVR